MMREPDHCTASRAEHGSVPRPLLAVVLLSVLAVLCASLGFWQLGRAGESRAAAQRFEAALELPAFTLETADAPDDGLRYRRVTTTGRYVPERQVLIDAMVHDGAVGYLVLTPFAPDDGGPWLIVNRGWVPADAFRGVLPDVAVEGSARRVTGVLDRLPSPGLRLGDAPPPARDAPLQVMTFPTMDALEDVLGRRLFAFQLRLDADQPDGFVRELSAPGLPPERHLGYAVQWWLFGAIAGGAALVIAARTLRRRIE